MVCRVMAVVKMMTSFSIPCRRMNDEGRVLILLDTTKYSYYVSSLTHPACTLSHMSMTQSATA